MSEKPKPRWFRFQLLTLMLMSLTGAGIVHANCRLRENVRSIEHYYSIDEMHICEIHERQWGWPWAAASRIEFLLHTGGQPEVELMERLNQSDYSAISIICDAAVAALMVAVVAFISEYFLRRREGRKHSAIERGQKR